MKKYPLSLSQDSWKSFMTSLLASSAEFTGFRKPTLIEYKRISSVHLMIQKIYLHHVLENIGDDLCTNDE